MYVMTVPAYAHSLSRGTFGMSRTIAPGTFQTPMMVRR